MLQSVSLNYSGEEYILETGKWAKQAGGSVVLRWGKLVIMSNATAAGESKEGQDFFPLTVDYREKFYASGQIPGGFYKREGRPSEKEILISRVTDRPIRPLFPENYLNELQIFVTLLSSDGLVSGDVHAITVASASLMISDIPFDGPVAGVRVGRIDGNFILFPTNEQLKKSDLSLGLAGTEKAVTMIEGSASELSEAEMIAGIEFGHAEIKKICAIQRELAKKAGKPKAEPVPLEDHSELKKLIYDLALEDMRKANSTRPKHTREGNINKVKADAMVKLTSHWESAGLDESAISKNKRIAKGLIELVEVDVVRDQIFKEGIRADGRKLDEIRSIDIEVGVLPGVHGSAVFTRGETQSLGIATLGSADDAQGVDDIEGERDRNFYLHYNFLPFSVGEVRRYGGPGRREIGHGNLAEKALESMVPDQEEFPYTIRIVSEILESNGSSSMATVCSGSLAMMDAGIPIKSPVAGVAMGLITEGDKFAVLTDIAGLEDHFGDMDFKVTGTEKGITAFQMDLKVQGIGIEIMREALDQAKKGRFEILGKMNAVLAQPRAELSPTAPRITTIQIEKDKIGELIGPSGKNIRKITETTGTKINVDDDGLVKIFSSNAEASDAARTMIQGQFAEPEIDKIYGGTVKKIMDFGAFIEIFPGKDGLCHISKISHKRIANVNEALEVGQKVNVKVLAVDRQGRISLSIKDADENS